MIINYSIPIVNSPHRNSSLIAAVLILFLGVRLCGERNKSKPRPLLSRSFGFMIAQFQPSVQPSPSLSRLPAFAVPVLFEAAFEVTFEEVEPLLEPVDFPFCALKSDWVSRDESLVSESVPLLEKSSDSVAEDPFKKDAAEEVAPAFLPRHPEKTTVIANKKAKRRNKIRFFIVFTVFLN